MIKFLIIVFVGLSLIPAVPFVYGKYVEWDISSPQFDDSPINKVFDAATPSTGAATAKQGKDINPSVVIIDIRESKLFNREHVRDAVNLPQEKFAKEVRNLVPDEDTSIYIYDDNLDKSAAVAIRYLRNMGYSKSFVMQGGVEAWRKAGYDVVIDKYAP